MLSSVFLFLNIGTGEMVLILFAALMLFGGEKLPDLARGLGKGIREFKDASEDVKREINNQINNYTEEKKPEPKIEIAPVENTVEHGTPLLEENTTDHEVAVIEHAPVAEHAVPNTIPVGDNHASAESHINLSKSTPEPADTHKQEEYKS